VLNERKKGSKVKTMTRRNEENIIFLIGKAGRKLGKEFIMFDFFSSLLKYRVLKFDFYQLQRKSCVNPNKSTIL
jgi:hypothetical protein